jgi:hypothetical protein
MNKEIKLLKLGINDYLTRDMLKIMLFPLIGSLIVLYFTFFSIATTSLESFENLQVQIEQQQTKIENGEVVQDDTTTISYTGNSVLDFLLKYSVTSWIVSFLVYVIGIFVIGYLSIFISLIIIGFLTPRILAIIHKRHYKDLELYEGYGTITNSIFMLLKSGFVMLILLFAFIPLYFIPVLNVIAIAIPFYYFFHKMINFDVSSTLLSREQYKELYYKNKDNIRIKTLGLYLLSLIPFVAFFIAVFYVIYIGHIYYGILEDEKRDS